MKKLLIMALAIGLITAGGTTAVYSSAGTGAQNSNEPVAVTAQVSQPRSFSVQTEKVKEAETITKATEATTWVCINPENCPNNGVPKQDGTGYKGGSDNGKNNQGTCLTTENCPNNGVAPQDGTGYKGGTDNGGNGNKGTVAAAVKANNGSAAQNGTGYKGETDNGANGNKGTGTGANAANCPNDGVPKQDGTGAKKGQGKNR